MVNCPGVINHLRLAMANKRLSNIQQEVGWDGHRGREPRELRLRVIRPGRTLPWLAADLA